MLFYYTEDARQGSSRMEPVNLSPPSALQKAAIRLLILPLLVYIAWLIEIFLLERQRSLFETLDPLSFILYTLVGCILIGTIIPVFLIHRSFLSGDVNMYQIGFRSLRRTVVICTITGIACFFMVLVFGPAGISRMALGELFLLYLPTGIASVMICWVLAGTHIQALVRPGGVLVSISTGVVITSILFSLTTVVHSPSAGLQEPLVRAILLGMVTALFFFALRDVYATVMVLTTGMVLLSAIGTVGMIPGRALPLAAFCAIAAGAALLGVHGYFSRRYATVIVAPDP
jgi:hypothetical protein